MNDLILLRKDKLKWLYTLCVFLLGINLTSCSDDIPGSTDDADKSMTTVTFGVTIDVSEGAPFSRTEENGKIFDDFYSQMKNGRLLPDEYELDIMNVNSSTVYHISGRWASKDPVTIPTGVYKITGSSKADGTSIQDKCSLTFNETVTITSADKEIILHGIYESSLLIINSSEITEIRNFNGETSQDLYTLDSYRYAYINDNLYLENYKDQAYIEGTFTNGTTFKIETGNLILKKGSYYVISSLDFNLILPRMSEGWLEENAANAMGDIQVETLLDELDSQPFLAGAYIYNYEPGKIVKKGLIVSKWEEDLFVTENTVLDQPIFEGSIKYPFSHEETGRKDFIYPKDTWMLDLTCIPGEEYLYAIKYLDGDTDYYVKAFVVDNSDRIIYGQVEKIHTLSFLRENRQIDYANVLYHSEYTLFDLVTDEIINKDAKYFYSTNEFPDKCSTHTGIGWNSCYKFLTEHNYRLWRTQDSRHIDSESIVSRPAMTLNDDLLFITPASSDKNKDITIYYTINGSYHNPESYNDIYSSPIKVRKGDKIHCYAMSSDNCISFTNSYIVL